MLKQKYIVIITIISGIALLGLIAIQFYWINEAIAQGETELENNIVSSIDDILEETAKYEALSAINNNDPYQILKKLNDKLNGSVTYDSLGNTFYFNSQNTQASLQNDLLNQLMSEMMQLGQPANIEERIPKRILDSIIDQSLTKNGIKTNYQFGVFDANNEFIYGNTNNLTNLQESKYLINLFPMDMFNVYFLSLHIPNERKIVIRSMWMMLGVSALFVLIIIFAFYFSIATIVKQKKTSMIKNDFINNMTHELKTPISTISLACEALSDKSLAESTETRHRFINMISEENKRLGTLVENVLQSAVLERGDLKLKKEELNIHKIINKAVQNINIQVQQRNGYIDVQTNAKNTMVFGDKIHISNVIFNLLDNANKYSSETPRIKVKTSDVVGGILIVVKDEGVGIAKEHQNKVFEKLYRVPTGDRHDVKGFGLGLSYVKSIIETHEGKISLESALGKGSTFTIYLPTIKNKEDD